MEKYEVKDVVCDYGVFKDGELIAELILNSRRNALQIADILNADCRHEILPMKKEIHAHWIIESSHILVCSNCGTGKRINRVNIRPKFCNECGAEMDKSEVRRAE